MLVVDAVVEVVASVVVVVDEVVVVSSASDPEQAVRNSPSAVRQTRVLRIGGML
jgi:hypothetical protein